MAAAPALFEARKEHSMVWTGTELLIWGGLTKSSAKRDGVRWSLATNTWKAMSSPPASILNRYGHAAVWTGSRMIIWSGEDYTFNALEDGAVYDPVTDSWSVLPAAPIAGRSRPGTIWTGKQMIVWGGDDKMSFGAADGAAFDPSSNKWTKLPAAPINGRNSPQVVFDGKDMIVWGGANSSVERTGARFDPGSLTWTMLADAPLPARGAACAAPTSGGMFVFGGIEQLASDPYYATIPNGVVLDGLAWSETSIAPLAVTSTPGRVVPMCWCTGGRCFVWSGQKLEKGALTGVRDGFVYDLSSGEWSPMMATAEPAPRAVENPVWTGTFAAVWGGAASDTVFLRDGAIYVP